MASKYDPLREYLRRKIGAHWRAGFDDVERVLGFRLPQSAREYPAWWSNEVGGQHVQSHSWQDVGWEITDLDIDGERVTFRRRSSRSS